MASKRRVARLNSLLKEVISETITRDLKEPRLPELLTITQVEVAEDIQHAKVYFSVIGDEAQKKLALELLNDNAGFIAARSSKKVVLRFFPSLTFKIDESLDHAFRIETLLNQVLPESKEESLVEDSETGSL